MTVVLWILLALLALVVFVLAVPFGAPVAYIGGELAVDQLEGCLLDTSRCV